MRRVYPRCRIHRDLPFISTKITSSGTSVDSHVTFQEPIPRDLSFDPISLIALRHGPAIELLIGHISSNIWSHRGSRTTPPSHTLSILSWRQRPQLYSNRNKTTIGIIHIYSRQQIHSNPKFRYYSSPESESHSISPKLCPILVAFKNAVSIQSHSEVTGLGTTNSPQQRLTHE